MPANSKSQQRLMGMVRAYQKGELDDTSVPGKVMDKIKKTANSIKPSDAKELASTKHKDLPEQVTENVRSLSFKQYLVEVASNT